MAKYYQYPDSLGNAYAPDSIIFHIYEVEGFSLDGIETASDILEGLKLGGGPRTELARIDLYVPQTVQDTLSANWSEEKFSGMITDLVDIAKRVSSTHRSNVTAIVNDYLPSVVGMISDGAAHYLELNQRQTKNPYQEFLFNQMSFRTHSYTFQFRPRSLSEYNQATNIIKWFRKASAPNYTSNSERFLTYPYEVSVEFSGSTIPIVNRAAITSVDVNYTADGKYVAFGSGKPASMDMTITLQELEMLTRDKIEAGM